MKGLAVVVSIGSGLAFSVIDGAKAQERKTISSATQTRILFAITFRPGPAWKPGEPMKDQGLRDHGLYWNALYEKGQVFAAGRLGSEAGLALFHARDQAEAERILAEDPAIKAGIFLGEARPWVPRFLSDGRLTVSKP
ncbi:MAG TPA: YciI family protein [Allosphingosinicella sp.]